MSFHPISGLFSPGEGPALREDATGCAHEESGRWLTRRCRQQLLTHVVVPAEAADDDPLPLLCGPHAEVWRDTQAARSGLLAVTTLGETED